MTQLKTGALLSYVNILLTNIIGLLLTPYIVRSLGDSEYGLYTLIGSFVGYLSVMDLGLNNTIVRYVSKHQAEGDKPAEEKFLGAVFIIYFIISGVVIVLGTVLYWNLEQIFGGTLTADQMYQAKIMMLILIFNLAITLPGGAFTGIANAYEHFIFPRVLMITKYVVRSILVVVILYYGARAIGIVILDTIVNLTTIILTFIYVRKRLKVKFDFSRPEKKVFKEIFSYSVWIFLFALISQLQWEGGQFIIGTTLDTVQVAVYAIGIMLGGYYGAFSGAISSVFLPRATQMVVHNNSPEELTKLLVRIGRFAALSLIIIFIGFVFLGQSFITLWVGEKYKDAFYVSLIIMIGYTIPLVQTFANSLLEAKKLFKFKTFTYLTTIGGGTGIGYLLVQEYGIIGVVACIVIGWMIGVIIMNIYFIKVLGLNILTFFKELSKGLFATFIITLVIGYFITKLVIPGWLGLGIKGILLFAAYAGLLFTVGMNREEKAIIKGLIWKR